MPAIRGGNALCCKPAGITPAGRQIAQQFENPSLRIAPRNGGCYLHFRRLPPIVFSHRLCALKRHRPSPEVQRETARARSRSGLATLFFAPSFRKPEGPGSTGREPFCSVATGKISPSGSKSKWTWRVRDAETQGVLRGDIARWYKGPAAETA